MVPSRGRREPICPSWGKKKKWGSIHYRMIWLYSELNYVETIRRPSHRKGIDSPSPADVILITSERSARRSNLPIRSCPMTTTRPAAGQNAHQSMHQRRRRGARLPNLLQWSIALHTYRVASGIILSCCAQGGTCCHRPSACSIAYAQLALFGVFRRSSHQIDLSPIHIQVNFGRCAFM